MTEYSGLRYFNKMKDFIAKLREKTVHVVGVAGAEGSSILRFLVKHNITNITAHDFSRKADVEKNFKLWHKGIEFSGRDKLCQQFQADLNNINLKLESDYLEGIEKADIIFVPQSWRLYKKENRSLFGITDEIPFYSLTRLYLDCAPAKIVAVTGTVGKGSTANIIHQLLKKDLPAGKAGLPAGRQVYYAGNDTWMPQLADKLDEMGGNDILVLEISHRQLQDGFSRAPKIAVITNLYPNHLDEVTWEKYINLKLTLVKQQQSTDMAILNYDIPLLRLKDILKSKTVYFSGNSPDMNTKSIQKIHALIMNNKSDHYSMNMLAGISACEILGLQPEKLIKDLPEIKSLPARLELLKNSDSIKIYDDIKSTTPWATLAGVRKLGKNTILICGGRTKGIDYNDFAVEINQLVKGVIMIKSEMGGELQKLLPVGFCKEVNDFTQALQIAYKQAQEEDNILISPAAGFFYSDFIKGRASLRKLVTSLLPKEPV